MGNAGGRENGGGGDGGSADGGGGRSNGARDSHAGTAADVPPADLMVNSPPQSPRHLSPNSPLLLAPQVPVVSLQGNGLSFYNQFQRIENLGTINEPFVRGIPTLITWSYGGNHVAVEGSWDNWRSRKTLDRSGKDHTIILVLPSGIYHYKFIVDGSVKYIPNLPYEADGMGHVCNLLDVHEDVPENFEGVREFEAPPSPDTSYSHSFLSDEDFAKEPVEVPPQLQLTVLDTGNIDEAASSSTKPQHVVLDHLFIEKGWASQSVLALGLTHRFQSKYVTVVLYKPLNR
ncbi:SNF1-related protein kinase regulatory subunit beta-1 isoform X2 [Coffea arabica]|uniref:SNF1-related protein kinase regulatory subunit beta-1 isoform X2 n=1 Tax=Coffea arabica TaxID=13443 RepID=A0A6P6TS00_COFAR